MHPVNPAAQRGALSQRMYRGLCAGLRWSAKPLMIGYPVPSGLVEARPMCTRTRQYVPVHVRRDSRSCGICSDVEAVVLVEAKNTNYFLNCPNHRHKQLRIERLRIQQRRQCSFGITTACGRADGRGWWNARTRSSSKIPLTSRLPVSTSSQYQSVRAIRIPVT